jgi:HSP20 family molecular chaperone IbpA
MTRVPTFNSPYLLGFDEIERALDRVAKTSGDGYPPYNIERLPRTEREPERLRITLAVAGFTRQYLHRGIAARQFQRVFLLAEGMEVMGADLSNGLLSVDLVRPEPERIIRRIDIHERD